MKKTLLIFIIIILCGCSKNQTEISCTDTEIKINNGAVLVDVRSFQEYNGQHLKNAINIPLDSIDRIEEEITDKNTEIIVYCHSGNRSSQALTKLKAMGYKKVYDLGAMQNC